MAHRKQGGTAVNLKDSPGQRLGIKKGNGAKVDAGNIIVRQRGTRYRAGQNVRLGRDDTLYAATKGTVKYLQRKRKNFTGALKLRVIVEVV